MLKITESEQPCIEVFEGVTRRTLACGKDVLMARFDYKKNSKVPPHKHGYEQVTTIIEGEQKIIVNTGDDVKEIFVKTGESYIIPSHYEHEQISITASVTIDAWSIAP